MLTGFHLGMRAAGCAQVCSRHWRCKLGLLTWGVGTCTTCPGGVCAALAVYMRW